MKTFVEFTDGDGHNIRVQWSSSAMRPMARVYVERSADSGLPAVDACIHLTEPQVAMLIAGLQQWQADVEDQA